MSGWPAPTAAEAWTHIDTQVLGAPAASVSFTGIAAAAAPRLRAYGYFIKDGTGGNVLIRFNNDSGANYTHQELDGDGGTATAARTTAQTALRGSGDVISANDPSLTVLDVEKPIAGEVGRATWRTAVESTSIILWLGAGEWTNTGALINRLDLIASATSFAAGTRAVLEGAA